MAKIRVKPVIDKKRVKAAPAGSVYVLARRRPNDGFTGIEGDLADPELLESARLYGSTQNFTHSLLPSRGGRYLKIEEEIEPQEVPADILDQSIERVTNTARRLMAAMSKAHKDYSVDTIKMKLALNGEVGLVFLGEAKVETSIEITVKRAGSAASTEPDVT